MKRTLLLSCLLFSCADASRQSQRGLGDPTTDWHENTYKLARGQVIKLKLASVSTEDKIQQLFYFRVQEKHVERCLVKALNNQPALQISVDEKSIHERAEAYKEYLNQQAMQTQTSSCNLKKKLLGMMCICLAEDINGKKEFYLDCEIDIIGGSH